MIKQYQYSVALSFLSEDERLAEQIRYRLAQLLAEPVFLYTEQQAALAGRSFEAALSPPFETLSRVVVVLYRSAWGKSGGTLVEYRAITRRRLKSDEEFLFPIVVESGATPPTWAEDILYHDLAKYGLDAAIAGIIRMTQGLRREHESESPSNPTPIRGDASSLAREIEAQLCRCFETGTGPLRGFFVGPDSVGEMRKWQSLRGELVGVPHAPKLPYYQTYWGYEAALKSVPEKVRGWCPITLAAIAEHFGASRWLKVVREYSFAAGPKAQLVLAETVRHSARAAEIVHLLAPQHPLVSSVAWDLITEAGELQAANGGWREFRDDETSTGLWPTVYVFRLISKLQRTSTATVPDEKERFLKKAEPLLNMSESFLERLWFRNRWALEQVAWDEGAAAVLGEIAPFVTNEALLLEVYNALRSRLTPAGKLRADSDLSTISSEHTLSLRIAYAMHACGRDLATNDTRYLRLVAALKESFAPREATAYDLAFAQAVFS